MRYLKHYFEDIAGIEIYPLISLLIFFLFFVGLSWYVIRMGKAHVAYMSAQPLSEDPADESNYPENSQP